MIYHRVNKHFSGAGLERIPGEAMQPDAYPNGRRLIQTRFLSQGAVHDDQVVKCDCGRAWVTEIAKHPCKKPAAPASTK